mmetsp:Transcript_27163/g.69137  ORF Transcript_27163/g.69137 Transcript_27163/m.69137 type:complete len:240 (-) Transcript_27163:747-1466(-)
MRLRPPLPPACPASSLRMISASSASRLSSACSLATPAAWSLSTASSCALDRSSSRVLASPGPDCTPTRLRAAEDTDSSRRCSDVADAGATSASTAPSLRDSTASRSRAWSARYPMLLASRDSSASSSLYVCSSLCASSTCFFCTSAARCFSSVACLLASLCARSLSALSRPAFSSSAAACAPLRASRSLNPCAAHGHSLSGLSGPPAAAMACLHLISSTPGGLMRWLGSTTFRNRCWNL